MKPQHSTPNPQRVLVLMRHAKTESPYSIKRDMDRRLTPSGEQDATNMGEWLKSQGFTIDKVVSSTARRTQQTTERVIEQLGLPLSAVEYLDELYHATPETFLKVIQTLPDSTNTVLIVSHNDGITQFANQLTDARIDCMQPGSVFAVETNIERWSDFKGSERTFLFYKQP